MRNGSPRGRPKALSVSGSIIVSTLSRRRAARHSVEFCRHDEIVFVQALDLHGAQRHRRIAPAERDVGVVHLGFGERGRSLDKPESLAEILEAVGPLDSRRTVGKRPIRCLPAIIFGFLAAEWRYAAAARGAALLGEC